MIGKNVFLAGTVAICAIGTAGFTQDAVEVAAKTFATDLCAVADPAAVADIPAGDVLVEASRSIKHLFQTNQIVDIQVANSYATFTEHPTERTLATG